MESRWIEADAARAVSERAEGVSEALALRTYSARLLGKEGSLVLHGGGNTSVKARAKSALGEEVDVLHVKGSGWDLATIEAPGHPAVRMDRLVRLLEQASMTDEQMVNELRLAMLDASGPTPSVETLLHAALPARFIDHTHADAILAIADQPDAEKVCREVFGDTLLWIPYVMPGFGLAKACKKAWDGARNKPSVMVLERHGVFTFGDSAKESYERMIAVVTTAERFAADRRKTQTIHGSARDEALEARVAPILRGALANAMKEDPEKGWIVALRTNDSVLAFLDRTDACDLTQRGCATPDHVIRTKPLPMFVGKPELGDDTQLRERFEREIANFGNAYDRYFETMVDKKRIKRTKLDPFPRVVLVPKVGIFTIGKTKKDAEIAADIYEHTIHVITDAEEVGTYAPLPMADLFDVEYWSLEQAKIKKEAEKPLARRVAVVTGAASGIGRATAEMFLALGAHVVACDRDPIDFSARPELAAIKADVTKKEDIDALFRLAARTFGGVDVVVSNAGNAPQGTLDTDEGEATLRASMELNFHSHLNVAARAIAMMRAQNRPGVLLFNASKSAFNPGPAFGPYAVAKSALVALMKQYAVDHGKDGIRANAVNADRIRTNIFAGGTLESRAKARGLSVDEYFRSNLLGREVLAEDVAKAFAWLAEARATTGCVVTVDGGNAAAFPR